LAKSDKGMLITSRYFCYGNK